jgi:hypothetical protein
MSREKIGKIYTEATEMMFMLHTVQDCLLREYQFVIKITFQNFLDGSVINFIQQTYFWYYYGSVVHYVMSGSHANDRVVYVITVRWQHG